MDMVGINYSGFGDSAKYIRGVLLQESVFDKSSSVLTYFMLRPNASWGVGTNVLSDIYMDFGLPGVPALMTLLGMFAGWIERLNAIVPTLWNIVIYLVTAATMAELPRYALDFPVRGIVWTWIMLIAYESVLRCSGASGGPVKIIRNLVGIKRMDDRRL